MNLKKLMNNLMGAREETELEMLLNQGFIDSKETTKESGYIILDKDKTRVIYNTKRDTVVCAWEKGYE